MGRKEKKKEQYECARGAWWGERRAPSKRGRQYRGEKKVKNVSAPVEKGVYPVSEVGKKEKEKSTSPLSPSLSSSSLLTSFARSSHLLPAFTPPSLFPRPPALVLFCYYLLSKLAHCCSFFSSCFFLLFYFLCFVVCTAGPWWTL